MRCVQSVMVNFAPRPVASHVFCGLPQILDLIERTVNSLRLRFSRFPVDIVRCANLLTYLLKPTIADRNTRGLELLQVCRKCAFSKYCIFSILHIFSRPFFNNGRAVVMSCRPSVCLSVTDVLWLGFRAWGKTFYTNN